MFLKNSTYQAAVFLIRKFGDNLATPTTTPIIVQKIIPRTATNKVFSKATT